MLRGTRQAQRLEEYASMVAAAYQRARAVNVAVYFGIDDVLDPATRGHGSCAG